MTIVLRTLNVNSALIDGLWLLKINGIESNSRNGRVIVAPGPVITEYQKPCQRVLFSGLRDANPFFHLMESLWMLDGRNDVKFPAYYAANIASFSDDGVTVSGAYGERWRDHFGYDQLPIIIDELKANPDSRRCVLTMWDASSYDEYGGKDSDLHKAVKGGKDVPCNTQVFFDTLGGKLNITVTCRSNDVVWGAYGANAVHFSMLHEYVALATGIEQGVYRQFSNNYHIYADRPDVQRLLCADGSPKCIVTDEYVYGDAAPWPLISTDLKIWHDDMDRFFGEWREGGVMHGAYYVDPFWSDVVVPLVNAHHYHKAKAPDSAMAWAKKCKASDWRIAAMQWLDRRSSKC